jgi:hypothetical protein
MAAVILESGRGRFFGGGLYRHHVPSKRRANGGGDSGGPNEEEENMHLQRRDFFLAMALALAAPASAQTVAPTVGPATHGGKQGTASAPDFSGIWLHPSLPGFEPLSSGPTSLVNRSRRNGVSDVLQLVGDYTNPILKPEAAEVVKKHGEISLGGWGIRPRATSVGPEAFLLSLQVTMECSCCSSVTR